MKEKLIIAAAFAAVACGVQAQSSTTVTISPQTSYQTMRSFGASDCWMAEYVGCCFNDAEKQKAARWLFLSEVDADESPRGIALSEWRVNLGAGSSTQGASSNISDRTRRAYNDGTDSLPKGIYVSDGKKTVK